MECKTKRTIILELEETEAFAIKSFIEMAFNELSQVPPAYEKHAQNMIDYLNVEGI